MHLQLKRPHNRLTQLAVLVCLFALLIICFAPLFSHIHNALTSQSYATIKTMTIQPMAMENRSMAGHDHSAMVAAQGHPPSNQMTHQGHQMTGECGNVMVACGYCSLLFHLNWLNIKSVEIIPSRQSRYPNLVTRARSRKYCLPLIAINPRAPPEQNLS